MSKNTKATYLFLYTLIVVIYGFILAFGIVNIDQWRLSKSKEYLGKANIELVETEKMLLFEKAAALDPGEDTYLVAGVMALKLGDNELAQHYLSRVKTADGYSKLADSYYNLERFELSAEKYQQAINIDPEAGYYLGLGKSLLKQGNINNSKTALENAFKLKKADETANLLLLLGSRIDVSGVTTSSIAVRVSKQETDPTNKAILIYNELNKLGYPQSSKRVLQEASEKRQLNRNSLFSLALEQITKGDYDSGYSLLQQARTIDPYYPQIYKQLVLVCEKLGKTDEAKQYQGFYSQLVF